MKYLLILLFLFPLGVNRVNAQEGIISIPKTLDTLNSQFYWLLQIYLSAPCQAQIPVTTSKRTFTIPREKLWQSLEYIHNEMKWLDSDANSVSLEEIVPPTTECPPPVS